MVGREAEERGKVEGGKEGGRRSAKQKEVLFQTETVSWKPGLSPHCEVADPRFPTVSGSPKTTLRFNDSLEGLTEIRKAIVFMIMVYYNERIQIKITKE